MTSPTEPTPKDVIDFIREKKGGDADADGAQLILDEWPSSLGKPRCTPNGYCIVAELPFEPIGFTPFCIQRECSRALYVYLHNIRNSSPFDLDEDWQEFRRRLDGIPRIHWLETPRWKRTPKHHFAKAHLRDFRNADTRNAFFDVIDWSIRKVNAAQR